MAGLATGPEISYHNQHHHVCVKPRTTHEPCSEPKGHHYEFYFYAEKWWKIHLPVTTSLLTDESLLSSLSYLNMRLIAKIYKSWAKRCQQVFGMDQRQPHHSSYQPDGYCHCCPRFRSLYFVQKTLVGVHYLVLASLYCLVQSCYSTVRSTPKQKRRATKLQRTLLARTPLNIYTAFNTTTSVALHNPEKLIHT